MLKRYKLAERESNKRLNKIATKEWEQSLGTIMYDQQKPIGGSKKIMIANERC